MYLASKALVPVDLIYFVLNKIGEANLARHL
jgi:hypothetical protein